jgi:Resolvase, N terminal domain
MSPPESATMTTADLLPATVLKRKAVVYVRQSTQGQVQSNLESKRRQYELVDVARQRGFRDIEVIDDDLGRSASGMMARPGFERLVAWLCAGEVGAVLCFDASRLARNGRDWHHLLELCGLVEARVIDLDGVYDPCQPNDRLLLGMKGTMSEYELSLLRSVELLRVIRKRCGENCSSGYRLAIAGTRSARSRWTLTSASAALSGCCSTNSRSSAAPGKFCFGHRSSAAATDQPAQ